LKNNWTIADIGFAKLLPFIAANNAQTPERAIPVLRKDYLELVDWTGRAIRADKKSAIPENAPPILQRLGLNEKNWVKNVKHFESRFKSLVGGVEKLNDLADKLGVQWIRGKRACEGLYRVQGDVV